MLTQLRCVCPEYKPFRFPGKETPLINNMDYLIEIGKEVISVGPAYFPPTELDLLIGPPTKAIEKPGWKIKYDLKMLVNDMVTSDVVFLRNKSY